VASNLQCCPPRITAFISHEAQTHPLPRARFELRFHFGIWVIPAYSPARDWVEKHYTTNTVRQDERIFLGHNYSGDYANIVSYHKGISLREIVDQTPFKDRTVSVIIMRPRWMGQDIVIKPTEKVEFEVKPLDVVWIYDQTPIF
jgi:hypothetical protein